MGDSGGIRAERRRNASPSPLASPSRLSASQIAKWVCTVYARPDATLKADIPSVWKWWLTLFVIEHRRALLGQPHDGFYVVFRQRGTLVFG